MAAGFPEGFAEGVRRFNAGEFFEAHEAFEELLDTVEEDGRWDLLVALVQVAVGYHKCVSGHPGSERMLGLGAEKLAAFPDVAWGVDVAALRTRVAADVATLSAGRDLAARLASTPPVITMRA
jgi:predicted metal-dependent hydrolase